MTYKQAMRQRCKCGRFFIGTWVGDKKTGYPGFSRVSSPVETSAGIMIEEHAIDSCWQPQRIVR